MTWQRPHGWVCHGVRDGVWSTDFGGPRLSVDVPGDGVVRLRFAPSGVHRDERPWDIVEAVRDRVDVRMVDELDTAVRLVAGDTEVLVHDGGATAVAHRGVSVTDDGAHHGPRWRRDLIGWTRTMPFGTAYYGFGERTGPLDKRGYRYTSWVTDQAREHGPRTDSMYAPVPFRVAVAVDGRCHGLLVDTTWRNAFDLTAIDDGVEAVETEDAELRMWVVAGPSPDDVLDRYTALTGRPVLPPRWALGYHQTRWSYHDAAEVRDIARRLRQHSLPADVIGLDLDHMDRARPFTWSPDRFPRPSELHADLRAAGLRTVAILDCAVAAEPGYAVYDEGIERGYFLLDADGQPVRHHVWPGLAVLPDFTRADVRTWWGDWLQVLTAAGVSGVLVDMNEPSLRDRPIDDPDAEVVELPDDLPHGGIEGASHAEVHNVYGKLEVRAVAEGFRRLVPDERALVLTRAGYAGVQRHAGVWTGDNASTWEHLQMSVPQLVNLGLSGIPFAGADVGGFFGHCDPELLVRWMQLGAWYPLMRSNNAKGSVAQEPWAWGAEVLAACRRGLELRSRFLPYLGTCLAAAHRAGAPVLRPMWWPQPADARAHRVQDQLFVGPDILLAPVLQPGVRSRAVYLPSGRWFDWHTGIVHEGPVDVLLAAPLDGPAPLLARAGAVVPLGPVVQWSDQRPLDPLELHVFAGEDGTADGELYDDDGLTHDHERGVWLRTQLHWDGADMRTTTTGSYRPAPRSTNVIVHHADGTVAVPSDAAGHLDVGTGDVGSVGAEQEQHHPGDLIQ